MRFLNILCLITASIATASPIAAPSATPQVESKNETELEPRESFFCSAARDALLSAITLYWANEARGYTEAANTYAKMIKKAQEQTRELC
ncbi:hypothetical protein CEP51_000957 [Fusarium floridanum]|uniref:Ig-like domain-containing protein n=1 Tax=Fusarium floridanum TaxID=1325733 RepID=A0A428SJE8_9HYPO|nr:hypothetical protein CEP51_000957 [Fusarium floridanum]